MLVAALRSVGMAARLVMAHDVLPADGCRRARERGEAADAVDQVERADRRARGPRRSSVAPTPSSARSASEVIDLVDSGDEDGGIGLGAAAGARNGASEVAQMRAAHKKARTSEAVASSSAGAPRGTVFSRTDADDDAAGSSGRKRRRGASPAAITDNDEDDADVASPGDSRKRGRRSESSMFAALEPRRLTAAELRKAQGVRYWLEVYALAAPLTAGAEPAAGAGASSSSAASAPSSSKSSSSAPAPSSSALVPRWVHCDALRDWWDSPQLEEPARPAGAPFVYVVAASRGHTPGASSSNASASCAVPLVDVTRRYSHRWTEVERVRKLHTTSAPDVSQQVQGMHQASHARGGRGRGGGIGPSRAARYASLVKQMLGVQQAGPPSSDPPPRTGEPTSWWGRALYVGGGMARVRPGIPPAVLPAAQAVTSSLNSASAGPSPSHAIDIDDDEVVFLDDNDAVAKASAAGSGSAAAAAGFELDEGHLPAANAGALLEGGASSTSTVTGEAFPTTIDGFKAHPLYALERHLRPDQLIYPKGAAHMLGTFKKETVYPRSHVHTCLTAQGWRRSEMRAVKQAELGSPALVIDKRPPRAAGAVGGAGRGRGRGGRGGSSSLSFRGRGRGGAGAASSADYDATADDILAQVAANVAAGAGAGEGDLEPSKVQLYGRWQTEPWAPTPYTGGPLPVNEYGNFELWGGNPAALPAGLVHITDHHAPAAAKKLGVPHARVVTGFEHHAGRATPVLAGIVVADESAQLVRDSAEQLAQTAEMTAVTKRHARAVKAWERLTRSLQLRERIKREYGYSGAALGAGTTAAGSDAIPAASSSSAIPVGAGAPKSGSAASVLASVIAAQSAREVELVTRAASAAASAAACETSLSGASRAASPIAPRSGGVAVGPSPTSSLLGGAAPDPGSFQQQLQAPRGHQHSFVGTGDGSTQRCSSCGFVVDADEEL